MRLTRKGVSPIIATVILVLIAVVAGVLLWLWVSGYSSALPSQNPALYERIKIEAVNVSSTTSTKQISIYVRNIGNADVTISSIYILRPDGTMIENPSLPNNNPVTIKPGTVQKITVTLSQQYQSGYAYVVKVVTTNGVEAAYTFVWP